MSKSNDLRSQSLDLLRFPLAVVVLMIHTFSTEGFTVRGTEITLESMPIVMEVNYFIDGFLRGQSVPIYFFISGYVFFLGVELTKETYVQKLKNRFKSLFIPYVVWNVLALLLVLMRLLPCFSSMTTVDESRLNFSFPALVSIFWDSVPQVVIPQTIEEAVDSSNYPLDVPLWFVRDLMIVVLCTPLIYWLLKRTRYYLVTLLGIAWFVLAYYWDLGHMGQLLTAFFFFSWGAYMSVNKKDMLFEFGRFFKSSMILYPLLALLYVASVHCFPELTGTIKRVNVFVGLLFAYNLAAWLLKQGHCKVNPFLAASSFFIYVGHTLICMPILKLLFVLLRPTGDFGMLAVYVLATALTVGLLLLAFYLLRRFTPGLLKVLVGRK